jgi:hypothetical protein
MAEAHRTPDHSLWFNPANFREAPEGGVLTALTTLSGGQTVSLLLNGKRTLWARFANGSPAMRAADAVARQTWDAIPVGSWVTVILAAGPENVLPPPTGQPTVLPTRHPPLAQGAIASVRAVAAGPFERQCERLFDAYLFVDWSATNRRAAGPGPDQLWLGELEAGNQPTEAWFASRRDCAGHVEQRLLYHVAAEHRVLVGFDFAYGYPVGFVDAAGIPARAGKWKAVWTVLSALLSDDEQNRSNRFEVAAALNAMITPPGAGVPPGPFWNTPAPAPMLTANSPLFPFTARNGVNLAAWRIVEQRLQQAGMHPHSVFKLFTAGSVGSQVLTGIPVLHRIRQHPLLRELSLVWPFETGFSDLAVRGRRPFVLHAEIWPGVVQQRADALIAADPQLIKDKAQVRAMCLWAEELDVGGQLGQNFSTPSEMPLSEQERCVNEEGWILGSP